MKKEVVRILKISSLKISFVTGMNQSHLETHDTPQHSEGVTNTPARPVGTTYDGLAESMENVTNTHL